MCIVFVALHAHPLFPVIVACNRDEFFDRPSLPMHVWEDLKTEQEDFVLAGRDQLRGGTWVALNSRAGFCALTNFREPEFNKDTDKRSRGEVPVQFMRHHLAGKPAPDVAQELLSCAGEFGGCNALCGDLTDPTSFRFITNRQHLDEPVSVSSTPDRPTFAALSNAQLDTPWPKLCNGKRIMQTIIEALPTHATQDQSEEQLRKQLFEQLVSELLLNRERVEREELLPPTGCPIELERLCSSICVEGEHYGTRTMTMCVTDHTGHVWVEERNRNYLGGDRNVTPLFALRDNVQDTWTSQSFEVPRKTRQSD